MQAAPMSRTRYMQEHRKMRFEEAYQGWTGGRLTQAEAALLLGQCERSFRRHVERYRADGLEGLLDKRLSQISKRRAAQAELDQVVQIYKSGFAGWNVAHFHSKYRSEFEGTRSYSWVKTVLQGAGLARRAKARGKHRIKRERASLPGMMVHQDASTHRWVSDEVLDLVVTMDDAKGRAHQIKRYSSDRAALRRPACRWLGGTLRALAATAAWCLRRPRRAHHRRSMRLKPD